MPTKIRLQRHGKKGQAYFHLVVADGRAPRDGKFIEKLGTYNPLTNPATIDIDYEKTLQWIMTGAQPSDTAKAILSYKGVMFKSHLLKGVAKKALTLEQAEAKYAKWLSEKENKISSKKTNVTSSKEDSYKKRMATEAASRQAKEAKKAAAAIPAETAAPEASADQPAAEEQAS